LNGFHEKGKLQVQNYLKEQERPNSVALAVSLILSKVAGGGIGDVSKARVTVSVGDELDDEGRSYLKAKCRTSRNEAVHVAVDGPIPSSAEAFVRVRGTLTHIPDLVFVGLEDGRFGLATADGRFVYAMIGHQLRRRMVNLQLPPAIKLGELGLAKMLEEIAQQDYLERFLAVTVVRSDDEVSGAIFGGERMLDRRDRVDATLALMKAHLDVASQLLLLGVKNVGPAVLVSGKQNVPVDTLADVIKNTAPGRQSVLMDFGPDVAAGPTGATLVMAEDDGVVVEAGCGLWMSGEISQLLLSGEDEDGRKFHFRHDGERIRRHEGHPADDLAPGRETARRIVARATPLRSN